MPRPAAGSACPRARVCLLIAGQAVPFPLHPLGREQLIRSLMTPACPRHPRLCPQRLGFCAQPALCLPLPLPSWRFLQEASQGCWGPRPATCLPGSLCFFPSLLFHVLIENKDDVGRLQTITGTTHLSLSFRDVLPFVSAQLWHTPGPYLLCRPVAFSRSSPPGWCPGLRVALCKAVKGPPPGSVSCVPMMNVLERESCLCL